MILVYALLFRVNFQTILSIILWKRLRLHAGLQPGGNGNHKLRKLSPGGTNVDDGIMSRKRAASIGPVRFKTSLICDHWKTIEAIS